MAERKINSDLNLGNNRIINLPTPANNLEAVNKQYVDTKLTDGSVTKLGTTSVGNTILPIYLKSGKPTPVTGFPESYLTWGGKNFSDSYGPIDASLIPELGANRTMFARATGIKVEYSQDNGETWLEYELTSYAKTALFSVGYSVGIGGPNRSTGIDRSTHQVRVILETKTANVYTTLNKFAIYLTTNGTNGNWCTIDARLRKNLDNGVDEWVTLAKRVPVNGWSGWNIINIPTITTYGNQASNQYGEIRFTFGATSHPNTNYPGLSISKIYSFGGVGWAVPSPMASNGHLYSFDANQDATFPGTLKSTAFKLPNGTSSQFLKADGSIDTNKYLIQRIYVYQMSSDTNTITITTSGTFSSISNVMLLESTSNDQVVSGNVIIGDINITGGNVIKVTLTGNITSGNYLKVIVTGIS